MGADVYPDSAWIALARAYFRRLFGKENTVKHPYLLTCGTCGRVLPLEDFSPSQRPYDLGGQRFGARCRSCHVAAVADRPGYVRAARREARRLAAADVAWLWGFDAETYRLPAHAVVHHADHDEENNAIENLVVLLPFNGDRTSANSMHALIEILETQELESDKAGELRARLFAQGIVFQCGQI